ncbi:MAG TPA: site-2 protease family protein [Gaiellaceae bacterium]|nr:site-2 protease family protein [Gaiellaceae bacterium]
MEPRSFPDAERDYRPINPEPAWRGALRKLWAPLALAIGLFVKFGAATFKFFGIFISVGGYALIWGWPFAVGFVALILVHELGHFVEAKRQGLNPSLPVFIPFLGAYVAMKNAPFDPWRNLLVSAAGPFAGGLASLGVWLYGEATDSRFLVALAFTGFLLNLFNLIPVRPLDGGFIWHSLKALRYGARERAPWAPAWRVGASAVVYGGLVAAFAVGMWAAHVPQDRL